VLIGVVIDHPWIEDFVVNELLMKWLQSPWTQTRQNHQDILKVLVIRQTTLNKHGDLHFGNAPVRSIYLD